MLSSIRKFSKSLWGKIVIGLIAIAFVVGFGFSGSFTGQQNIVAKINGEKISSQEFFLEYIQWLIAEITNSHDKQFPEC